jgi:hypothetical protein
MPSGYHVIEDARQFVRGGGDGLGSAQFGAHPAIEVPEKRLAPLCPNPLLLTVLRVCGGTSGPERLSSGRPRAACTRDRYSLLLPPCTHSHSCQRESLRSTFLSIQDRCSLPLPPNMPPHNVHFARPMRSPPLPFSAVRLESRGPIQLHRSFINDRFTLRIWNPRGMRTGLGRPSKMLPELHLANLPRCA